MINCEELDKMFLQIDKLEVVDNVESPKFKNNNVIRIIIVEDINSTI